MSTAQYFKDYAKKNADKLRAYKREYYLAHKADYAYSKMSSERKESARKRAKAYPGKE